MRAGGTLAVSSIWTNLIDCCKPILARRRNRRGPTALQGVSTWIHGDAAVCYFLRNQNSMPRSTRKYTHCCRTAPIPQQGTSSQVGARCCVDGVPTHRRQDAVPALCPKVDAFTPDSSRSGRHIDTTEKSDPLKGGSRQKGHPRTQFAEVQACGGGTDQRA